MPSSQSVINALSTKKVSYIELFFTNIFILVVTNFVEKRFGKDKSESIIVDYEIIEHLEENNRELLLQNLKQRLGNDVLDYEIMEANYLRDMAKIRVYLKNNK